MEVTFQIDAAQLSDDIRELLGSLSDAKKDELAVKILTEALQTGETTFAKYIGVDKALEDINKGDDKYRFNSEKNRLEQVDRHWVPDHIRDRFYRLTKQYAHFYGYFQEVILDKMLAVAVERVEKLVHDSPVIQKTIARAVIEIEMQFPHIVQASMQKLFLNMLEKSIRNNNSLSITQEEHGEMLKELQERLDRNNVY